MSKTLAPEESTLHGPTITIVSQATFLQSTLGYIIVILVILILLALLLLVGFS